MSKSRCFAVVLAAMCLPIILLSLEADAHTVVDETTSCGARGGSSTLEVRIISTNHHQNGKANEETERCGETNGTTLEEVANMMKSLASSQQEMMDEMRDQHEDLRELVAPRDCDEANMSKRALVSALVSNCVPLLIQQNINGSSIFNRSWAEFKVGFNNSRGNYWLGNELLSQLTLRGRYKLRFDLQSRSNTSDWYHAQYSTFIVLTEAYNYTLRVAGYSGNAGVDSFGSVYHNGMMFSTYDRDNDRSSSVNCAASRGGGFWYNACDAAQVNLPRVGGSETFSWNGLPGGRELQSSRMWLQCK